MKLARQVACIPALFLFLALHASAQGPALPENSDLAPERVRQAIATERQSIASHPRDPVNYIQLAYTLTDAGIVDQALVAVANATRIAPDSAFVYNAQAWVLHHNLIGIDYGKGFDYDASLASYRKAVQLDPDDLDLRQSLAEFLEYNRNGIRYAPDAHLDETIELYRFLKIHQNPLKPEVEDNFLINSFYAGHFPEVLAELAKVDRSVVRDGVAIAALAATRGTQAAVEFASHIGGDEQNRRNSLIYAAEGLWNMRLYPQAADMLTASLPDPTNSKQLLGQIQIFHNLKKYQRTDFPPEDPRSPVQRLIVATVLDTFTEDVLIKCIARSAFSSDVEWKRALAHANPLAGRFQTLSRQTGLPQVVLEDIALGSIKITLISSAEPGSRILVQIAGSVPHQFFVLQEEGSYKIVASNQGFGEVGAEALSLLRRNRLSEAEALLSWKRDLTQKEAGDDPLSGPLFSRLWIVGKSRGPEQVTLAAASLLFDRPALLGLLPYVRAMRKNASADYARDNLDLLLASMYLRIQDGPQAEPIATQLLLRQPDSTTALTLLGSALGLQKKWPQWRSILDTRLQNHPGGRDLLVQRAAEAAAEGDFARARASYRALLETGRASADDNNTFAWLSLFDTAVDDQAISAAQQANLSTSEGNVQYLQTLAYLDAAVGRTAEARQLLLQAMSLAGLEAPDSATWLGFGLIDEQYGIKDAAVAAYRQVPMNLESRDPVDAFALAQARLSALAAK